MFILILALFLQRIFEDSIIIILLESLTRSAPLETIRQRLGNSEPFYSMVKVRAVHLNGDRLEGHAAGYPLGHHPLLSFVNMSLVVAAAWGLEAEVKRKVQRLGKTKRTASNISKSIV